MIPTTSTLTRLLSAATAASLYQYNTPPRDMACALWNSFGGHCAELEELLRLVQSVHWATEMAAPTAAKFLEHALLKYGDEATERTLINLGETFTVLGEEP